MPAAADWNPRMNRKVSGSSTGALWLIDRIRPALTTIAPEGQTLSVAQLAPLDQFHLRGIVATSELAIASRIEPETRVGPRLRHWRPSTIPLRHLRQQCHGRRPQPCFRQCCDVSDRPLRAVGPRLVPDRRCVAFTIRGRLFRRRFPAACGDEHRASAHPLYRGAVDPGARRSTGHLRFGAWRGRCAVSRPVAHDASTRLLSESDARTPLERASFSTAFWIDDLGVVMSPTSAPSPPTLPATSARTVCGSSRLS